MLPTVVACLATSWRAGRATTAAVGALALTVGLLPSAAVWLGTLMIDELTTGRNAARVVALALAAAAAAALTAGLGQLGAYLAARLHRAITLTVQSDLYAKVSGFGGLRPFEDPRFRDRLRLAQNGAREAPLSVTALLSDGLRGAATVGGFAIAIGLLWPPMLLLLTVAAVPAYLSHRSLGRSAARTDRATAAQLYYRTLLTDPGANREIRLFGLGDLFRGRLHRSLEETTAAELGVHRRRAVVRALLGVAGVAVSALGTVVMALAVVDGRQTLGGLTMVAAATVGVQATLTALLGRLGDTTRSLAAVRHLTDVLAAPDDLPDGHLDVPPLAGTVEFEDVWFRYDDDGPWILRGVTFTLHAGWSTGLVGLNGAGKSTLVKLLCRFYDPQRGRIRWDGTDLRALRVDDLRRRIAATFQDFCRYELTAAENIGLGDVDRLTDRRAIARAAVMAGVGQAVAALPQGYDTTLVDGVLLSGGQWQRLAVARSLMRTDPDLVILDEPNAGLDAEAEHAVHTALRQSRRGRTTLLISHRLGAIRDADLIVVLAQGRVAEQGTHDGLMAAGGGYARLFRLQSASYGVPVAT
ncbi:ABC transporter ATP-binding protein [Virgisporangium aurantiacum]|uniref:ABC transporter n=1 Tax=Virgisporangium aurantiacum TaxID=175570 RepID=A0A8J4E059_9ACTN|nr:ABC transporter ATP-binding protein [Virgisporangium aurantiacum]GIJ56338.1 ABC transporter [Virgisporangium aurantiacum]